MTGLITCYLKNVKTSWSSRPISEDRIKNRWPKKWPNNQKSKKNIIQIYIDKCSRIVFDLPDLRVEIRIYCCTNPYKTLKNVHTKHLRMKYLVDNYLFVCFFQSYGTTYSIIWFLFIQSFGFGLITLSPWNVAIFAKIGSSFISRFNLKIYLLDQRYLC